MKLNLTVPDTIVKELDNFVDGIRFRSRAHLTTVILADWITSQKRIAWKPGKVKPSKTK
jgi:hypothetical protein